MISSPYIAVRKKYSASVGENKSTVYQFVSNNSLSADYMTATFLLFNSK